MRTSLTETEQIENWLLQRGKPQDRLLMEAHILANPKVLEKAEWQAKTYNLVRSYGRKKLLDEIKAAEYQLFNARKFCSFQNRIRSIFKR